jgi:hypothetical protein
MQFPWLAGALFTDNAFHQKATMGAITAKTLIDEAATTLQDVTNVRWSRAELLGYLNDGQRELVLAKPEEFVINAAFQLVAGSKQTIPADGNLFMRMNCNLGTDGKTPGRAPRHITINQLDEQVPGWRAAPADPVVLHYTFDEKDKKRFYNYPPQPVTGASQVEIVYSASPPDMAAETGKLGVDDVWKSALVYYMEFRAYAKDADYARQDGPAAAAYQNFANLIGIKNKVEAAVKATR